VRRILFLARAEVLHIVRDRTTLAQVLVVPIVQLLVLVNAATFVIRDTPTYIVDHDRTSASRGLVNRLAASGHFRILERSASLSRANDALLEGAATLVVTIPRDFESSLARTGRAPVQLVVNAEKGSAAGIVLSYAGQILDRYSGELGRELHPAATIAGGWLHPAATIAHPSPGRGHPRIETRTRGWYNASLDYRHYMVPGILVALVTLIGTLLSAQNIAREKELGTLEQLNVTPLTRGQFIAAKLLPLWVLGLFDLGLGLLAGKLVFDVPMRGSLLLLFVAAAIYLLVALAIGLLISTGVDTQQQAMFVTFFVLNVYLLLSGLFTPIDSMSPWMQAVSQLNPVRHFVTISRAILIKGAGLDEVAPPLLILCGFAVVTLTLAVQRYRKRTA
jgi:ABC-type multidrug transport system permease subunit